MKSVPLKKHNHFSYMPLSRIQIVHSTSNIKMLQNLLQIKSNRKTLFTLSSSFIRMHRLYKRTIVFFLLFLFSPEGSIVILRRGAPILRRAVRPILGHYGYF